MSIAFRVKLNDVGVNNDRLYQLDDFALVFEFLKVNSNYGSMAQVSCQQTVYHSEKATRVKLKACISRCSLEVCILPYLKAFGVYRVAGHSKE